MAPARVASIISRVNDHQPRMDRAKSCPTGPAAVFRAVDLATSRSGAIVAWRVGRQDLPTVLAGTGIAATGIHAPGVRTIHGDRGSARVSTATAVPVGRVFGPAPGRRTRKFLRSIVEADQATWATASQRREDPRSTAAVLRPRTGRADGAAGRARPSQFGVSAVPATPWTALQVARRVPQLCFEQSTSPHPDRVPLLHGELVDEICQPYLLARVSLPPAFMLRVSAPSMAIGVVPAPQPRQPCPSVVCSGQLLDEGPEDFFGRSSKRIRRHGQRPPGVERTYAAPLLSSFLGLAEPAEQRGASVRATSVSRRFAGDTVRAGTVTRAGAFCRPARTPPPQEDGTLRWR